jgi:hypothetical protein
LWDFLPYQIPQLLEVLMARWQVLQPLKQMRKKQKFQWC